MARLQDSGWRRRGRRGRRLASCCAWESLERHGGDGVTRDVRAALLAPAATLMTLLCLGPLLAGPGLAAAGRARRRRRRARRARPSPRPTCPAGSTVPGDRARGARHLHRAARARPRPRLGGFVPTPSSLDALRHPAAQRAWSPPRPSSPPAATDAGIIDPAHPGGGRRRRAHPGRSRARCGARARPGCRCCSSCASPPRWPRAGSALLGYLSAGLGLPGAHPGRRRRRVRDWGAVLGRRTRSGERGVVRGGRAAGRRRGRDGRRPRWLVGAVLPLLVPGGGGERLQSMVADRFGGGGDAACARSTRSSTSARTCASQDDTVLLSYATTDLGPGPAAGRHRRRVRRRRLGAVARTR